nr:uncharacterized mitochondrial protein AtMg00810-like [Tanacetum cinerariifolium]
MALLDKYQLKFNMHKDAKSLMEAIKKRFDLEDQSLDDLFNNLKIYEAEVNSSSSTSHNTKNIIFVSFQNTNSTNESVSVVTSVFAASRKPPASILPNVDNLSDVVIYSFFARFDMSKVECYNCHRRCYFARECRSLKDTRNKDTQRKSDSMETSTSNALVSQGDVLVAMIEAFRQMKNHQIMPSWHLPPQAHPVLIMSAELNSYESDVSVPTSPVPDRYESDEGYHEVPPPYTGTFMPHKPDLVFHDAPTISETVLTIFNVEPSTTPAHRHSWNRKACFVCKSVNYLIKDCDYYEKKMVQKPVWNHAIRVNHQTSSRMTHPHSKKHVVPTTVLTRSRLVPLNAARPVTTVVPQTIIKHQSPAKYVVNKPHSPLRRPINHKPSPKNSNFHQKVTTVKVTQVNVVQGAKGNWGNPHQALKDEGVIDSGCSRHMTGKISYISDFEEINEGYVPFGGNPKGGKITGKVTKPHNKTPYELLLGRAPNIRFTRPFGCLVTILNTLDPIGKFDGKADEGFLVGYSISRKAFRVFNSRTKIVQETLHINFLENQPNVTRSSLTWLFDIDTLTQSINYQPVVIGNQPNSSVGIQENFNAGKVGKELVSTQQYVLLPLCSDKLTKHDDKEKPEAQGKSPIDLSIGVRDLSDEFEEFSVNSTNMVNTASAPITVVVPNSTNNTDSFNVAGPSNTAVSLHFEIGGKSSFVDPSQYLNDPNMPTLEEIIYSDDEEDVGSKADFSNLETSITISPILTTRVHKDHPVTQIIGDLSLAPQINGFEDPDYPDKVYKVVKALYGLHQAPRAWYETLANDLLENGFQRKKIDQTLFIKTQKGDILLVQVYVDDINFGSTNKELCKAFEKLMKDKFWMSSMGELTFFLGLQVKQKDNGIFISQDKYVAKILRKFGLTYGKSASTPIDTEKPLLKDPDGEDVDVHVYRSMIGSLMYLTLSRPDIMFDVCACVCFQVTPKALHLHLVKRIFRYLKGKPHLGLWYPKDSPFNLVAYFDSDYARASLDRKSTTGGCQFLVDENDEIEVTAVRCIINAVSSKLMLFGLTIDSAHLMLLGHKMLVKKKMANKYCPRNEMKKIETELWNLEVHGTDLTRYNQHLQELALLYVRTCPEDSDRVERYIGGLPESIHGSVAASKPKTMKEATKMATGLMDKKIRTYAERIEEENGGQELYLMCVQTCPEESDRVERYIGGLPDSIHRSVAASKPKTMHEATEMATGVMDKKIRTYAERQAANKRKFKDTS